MKSSLTDPGLAEMLAALQTNERGHPGPGWFTAAELTQGESPSSTKKKADKLVDQGVYEKCQRVVSRNLTAFYRKSPSGVQQRRTMNRVAGSPCALIPSGKSKRAK